MKTKDDETLGLYNFMDSLRAKRKSERQEKNEEAKRQRLGTEQSAGASSSSEVAPSIVLKRQERGGRHIKLAEELAYLERIGKLSDVADSDALRSYVEWSRRFHAASWEKIAKEFEPDHEQFE